MNEKDLNSFFDEIAPNNDQKQKMLSQILGCEKKETLTIRRRTKNFSMLAAAVVICILTTTVVLAATFNWHGMLINYLNPSEKQMQEMAKNINSPNATVTKNGVTITVKQTLTDSHGVYVLYEMTVPEWLELTDDIVWRYDHLGLETTPTDGSYTVEQGTTILEQRGNKRTAILDLNQTATIKSGTAILSLEDLSRKTYDSNGNYEDLVPVIEGEWKLKWDCSYEDMSKTIETNEFVSINGSQNTISKVVLSPMSVYLCVLGDDILTSVRPVVNFKDGSQIAFDVWSKNKSFGYSSTTGNDLYYRFDKIINVDDVKNIIIGDTTIPISK